MAAAGRRRTPEERRADVAAAARDLALEGGLLALSLRALAARVGVSPALVAHYEPSMDVLVARTFTELAGEELAAVEQLCAAAPDPVAAMDTLLGAVADPERDPVATVWVDAWSLGRGNPALAAAARDAMAGWHDLAAGVVEAGCRAGSFRADDPGRVALVLFALVDAMNSYHLVAYRERAERDAAVRGSVAALLGCPALAARGQVWPAS